MSSQTFNVRGQKVRSQSRRRYIVVAVRPETTVTKLGTLDPFARVVKRSDNKWTAFKAVEAYGYAYGAFAVVVDTVTGKEV